MHHVVDDGCIREEEFLGHTQCRRENHVEQQWRKHAPLPETSPHVELIPGLSIIQPHACLYAVVELADDGERSRWYTQTSKDIPHRRVRSTGSYSLVKSMKHRYKGVSFFSASSCSRGTTSIMSTVELWGSNPHCCSFGRMFSRWH